MSRLIPTVDSSTKLFPQPTVDEFLERFIEGDAA